MKENKNNILTIFVFAIIFILSIPWLILILLILSITWIINPFIAVAIIVYLPLKIYLIKNGF